MAIFRMIDHKHKSYENNHVRALYDHYEHGMAGGQSRTAIGAKTENVMNACSSIEHFTTFSRHRIHRTARMNVVDIGLRPRMSIEREREKNTSNK